MGMTLTKEFVNSCRKVGALRDFLCQAIDQVDEKDKEIAELKQKLEDAKASAYADSVDAGMEIRRLKEMMPEYKQFIKDKKFQKELVDEYDGYVYEWMGHRYIATPYINLFIKGIIRALWLKRADDAKHLVTAYENYDYFDIPKMTIKQESARTWMTCRLRTPKEWVKIWKNVERKCRAKAEEYK